MNSYRRHKDGRKEAYITPDYLKRSMRRLCFFEDLPQCHVITDQELQPMMDKWESIDGFVPAQIYALRHYHAFKSKFVQNGMWSA